MFQSHVHQRPVRAQVYEEVIVDANGEGFVLLPPEVFKTEVVIEGGPIRMLVTGDIPTPDFGVPGYDSDRVVLSPHEAARFLAVRTGATNALLRATHFVLA